MRLGPRGEIPIECHLSVHLLITSLSSKSLCLARRYRQARQGQLIS